MTTPARRRMRSSSISLGITALMASSLTGCSSSADYAAVCVDPETQERVDDDQCDDDSDYNGGGSGFFWYYLGASSRIPAVGQTTSGGTFSGSTLNGTVQRGGLPTTGGSTVKSATTKGGFGGSSRGFG
ncbi:hypothetical protein [Nocardioides ganghwensis]|jgi:hypothetical protein|uniref:tRNA-dihydrouridine synthase n=1 Tax=Nocardioides ganghwensis TaxID=252230 RepID=A0A4Q2S980_9ACTN|nr:hypothetical protein [Nocardioides ganghwensis]MBD3947347.1 hypothetical protein [Nocardioides ganghwensis]RYC00289.1 hypothetical protein EUA07_14220 [Nocardioides ganghwensis]